MSEPDKPETVDRKTSAVVRLAGIGDWIADAIGTIGRVALISLSAGLILGIGMRWVGIDNTWTYDLDLFSLVWLAFAGAVLTARRDRHVTAGIALEHLFRGRLRLAFRGLRVAIVVVFLCLLAVSGWRDAMSSLHTHETTIDVVAWPMWIAKIVIPLGALCWAVAEISKFILRRPGRESN